MDLSFLELFKQLETVTWRHLYCVFTYIYSFLIEKDLRQCRNVSLKFMCALLVYLCLSSRDLSIFSVIPIFVLFCYFCDIHITFGIPKKLVIQMKPSVMGE
jgi:hypothetical protein